MADSGAKNVHARLDDDKVEVSSASPPPSSPQEPTLPVEQDAMMADAPPMEDARVERRTRKIWTTAYNFTLAMATIAPARTAAPGPDAAPAPTTGPSTDATRVPVGGLASSIHAPATTNDRPGDTSDLSEMLQKMHKAPYALLPIPKLPQGARILSMNSCIEYTVDAASTTGEESREGKL